MSGVVVVDLPGGSGSVVAGWRGRLVESVGHLERHGYGRGEATDLMASMGEPIHDYIGRGWSIIPIRPGDKRPLVRWEEFQHRRRGEAEARDWFLAWPDAGIAVVTGAVSGIVVIDVDVRHGGHVSLEGLEREHGRLPMTLECRTGGGGRHLYFAHPGVLIRNMVGLSAGVDLRGEGGYVVAPPSMSFVLGPVRVDRGAQPRKQDDRAAG